LGTAFRALGNGMRVLMLQFLKGSWHYGELDAAQKFAGQFELRQMGRGFVKVGGAETDPEDVRMVEGAWQEAKAAITSGDWDMVVLDEINYAIGYKMLDAEAVAEFLAGKPEMVHVVLTGRNAHPKLVELADTVTEMRQVKHAYEKGVLAQRGIEY
jgi:cob(I)alamin adenosyltransferase